jgi:hypothetical protein
MIEKAQQDDTFTIFLRSHILLAMKKPKEAIMNLIEASSLNGPLAEYRLF